MLESAINGSTMDQLIAQPYGCGEQNMIAMTLPVIATMYLDKTNQWHDVGFQKRDEALRHIQIGRLAQSKTHRSSCFRCCYLC